MLEEFGTIEQIDMPVKRGGQSPGLGCFVTFGCREDALCAFMVRLGLFNYQA